MPFKEHTFQDVLNAIQNGGKHYNLDEIRKAYDFAATAHEGQFRKSGEPYILHPIAVAKIVVSNIGLGCKSIIAALLHDVVEDTEVTKEDVAQRYSPEIAELVELAQEWNCTFMEAL